MTVTVNNPARGVFHVEEANSVGDSVFFHALGDDSLRINIDNPWAGDSISGFGRSCSIEIDAEDAAAFCDWLIAVLPKRKRKRKRKKP